jgi:hypothetical protein
MAALRALHQLRPLLAARGRLALLEHDFG